MSWFNLGVTKEELEQMDREYERKYGKVKKISEVQEYDLLPTPDQGLDQNEEISDTNIDQVVDYEDD